MPAGDVVEYLEREVKYDVAPDWVVPDLAVLAPDGGTIAVQTVRLTTTYFDTASRDLLATGVTLRRRTGDIDTGWQLKIPEKDARIEVRAELNGSGVPKSLRDLIVGIRSGEPLKALATLTTERTVHSIVDADGVTLAEVADDHVTAVVLGPRRRTTHWREVEIELGAGDDALLALAGRELTGAGALPATSASKLARALVVPGPEPKPDLTLGGLIRSYVTDQVDTILRGDLALRRDRDVVHATRVAIRRLRSVLRVFADVFDPERARSLEAELAWYGGLLGAVRDCEVLRVHLDDAVRSLPEAVVIGPVVERIDSMLGAERDKAKVLVARAMTGQRYLALTRELRAWRDEPAFADGHAPEVGVAERVRAAMAKVRKRIDSAVEHGESDESLHRARKAAKRARYVAELAEPRLGKKARVEITKARTVQELLGGVQDGVIAAEFLLRAARAAEAAPGESPFTFGVLYARESDKARAAAHTVRRALR